MDWPALAAGLALLAPGVEGAPPDSPGETGLVERVEVSLVRVDIRAVDRAGRPVTDLTADEVRVRHGKTELEVAYLERLDPPADPATARLALQAPSGETMAAELGAGGRTTLVLFDLLGTVPLTRERARRDLRAWIDEELPAGDRIGLASAEADFRMLVPPTADRPPVLAALEDDGLFSRPGENPLPGFYRDIQMDRMAGAGGRGDDSAGMGTARCETLALATLEALRTAVDLLAPLEGTKDVILVSEGFPVACPHSTLSLETLFDPARPYRDTEPNDLRYRFPIRKGQVRYRVDPKVPWSGIRGTFDRLLDAAARARVSFITVHPRSVGRFDSGGSELAAFQSTSLNALAQHTGGEHFAGGSIRKSLALARASREGSYELGFYRRAGADEPIPRELAITTTRRKTQIHHRRARGETLPAALAEPGALRIGSPERSGEAVLVPLTVDAATFRLLPAGPGRPPETRFSIGLTLVSVQGGIAASGLWLATVNGAELRPGRTTIPYRIRIDAPPGGYRLRASLSEPGGGALAEVETEIAIEAPPSPRD